MQDRVPLYPGRVKLTPVSGQENTYDMVRADEPTQEGTPLNKATLLKDATAEMFGLDATAVPDDALALLSRLHKGLGNEYVWKKGKNVISYTETEETPSTFSNSTLYYLDASAMESLKMSGSYVVVENYKTLSPGDPLDVLAGKYVTGYLYTTSFLYFYPDATFSGSLGGTITASKGKKLTDPKVENKTFGYVNSPDPNAYPPAVSDGFTYTALGQLGAGLKMELLWENADPLSYFPGQTISMDLSDVSQIMVMFRWDNTSDRDYVSKQLVIPVGGKGRNEEYGNHGVRTITVSTTGVTFSDDSKHYTYDQPWYIYGIKGVTA